jgi:hypothetical protein
MEKRNVSLLITTVAITDQTTLIGVLGKLVFEVFKNAKRLMDMLQFLCGIFELF